MTGVEAPGASGSVGASGAARSAADDGVDAAGAGRSVIVGVGMDLVDVDRFRTVLDRRAGFRRRVFTEGEREYAERANDPTQRYAARFAAKEAVMKSLGVGLGVMPTNEIEVVKAPSGAPGLKLHGTAAEVAARAGVTDWQITLSHTHTTAGAVVVATRND